MKLNGWTRLWIVLSVTWIILISALSYGAISDIVAKREYEIKIDGIGRFTVIASRAQSQSEVETQIKEKVLPEVESSLGNVVGKAFDGLYREYVSSHLSGKVTESSLLASLPPVGLLAFGWAAAWIRRGFRGSKKDA